MQTVKVPETPKYPDRPITMIVPFSAGSAIDLVARGLEKVAPKHLGQPLVIINKPGSTGSLGLNEVVSANPDGYTIGISGVEVILNPLFGATKYNYMTALDPLAQVTTTPWLIVVLANQPWKDVNDLAQYGKQHQGQLKFGHQGIGSLSHIAGETFVKATGSSMEQVPFRGGSETVAALLGGHIQVAFVSPALIKEYVRNGTIRVLAVTDEKRLTDPLFAAVPTCKEQGVDMVFNIWFDISAPKEIPAGVKNKLSDNLRNMISDPDFTKSIDNMGLQLNYLGPKEAAEQWQIDGQKLTKTVNETGILDLIKAQKQ
ncbi:tripartite tricarboxylate transporter substrate binding protein [Anaerospora sp.]|uniref:tripartite tricarboxylate transporter substrate binding protein n=1 Tax=Anaerospora sp. TaxID=1960278 RepID=UPI00289F9C12|nr:tripartite tricarboxylate transporter substrate binding protein [Anaerospora sp.]